MTTGAPKKRSRMGGKNLSYEIETSKLVDMMIENDSTLQKVPREQLVILVDAFKKDERLRNLPPELFADPKVLETAVNLSLNPDPEVQSAADKALRNPDLLRLIAKTPKIDSTARAAIEAAGLAFLTVRNGTGDERGMVVVECIWSGNGKHDGLLSVWRDTGAVHLNFDKLEESPSAIRLDFERAGRKLHFVDGTVEQGKSYTYYAVSEATVNNQRINTWFEKANIVVRTVEAPAPAAPTLEDFTETVVQDILKQKEDLARSAQRLEKILDGSHFSENEKKVIFARAKRRILSEIQQRAKK